MGFGIQLSPPQVPIEACRGEAASTINNNILLHKLADGGEGEFDTSLKIEIVASIAFFQPSNFTSLCACARHYLSVWLFFLLFEFFSFRILWSLFI